MSKFFYLALTTFESENHVSIIRDSFPTLTFNLPRIDAQWMQTIIETFFKNKANVTIKKTDEEPSLMYEDKFEIDFKFAFKASKSKILLSQKKLQENKELLFKRRLEAVFLHDEIVLQLHQINAVNKMWLSKKIVFEDETTEIHESFCWAHSTGSGKSYGSLSIFSKIYVEKVIVLCSNAALLQWGDYIKKMYQPKNSKTIFEIIGLTEFANILCNEDGGDEDYLKNQFVIFDEAHVFRNLTSIMRLQIDAIRKCRFVQTLTATLTVNHISDIIGLCEIHNGELSEDEIEALTDLETNPTQELVESILRRCFTGRIDYYDAKLDIKNAKNYAPLSYVIKEIPMEWEQTVDYMVKKRNNFKIADLCITTSARNSYRKNEKQISNSSKDQTISPKFDLCCDTITSFNRFPQIIYSNYLDNGIKGVHARLKRKRPDLRIDIATGTTKTADREAKRQAFNHGELDLLFLSRIGNASLDFHSCTALHLIEQFDNLAGEEQAVGRVRRFGGHKADKNGIPTVIIFKYISTFPNLEEISEEQKQEIKEYFFNTYCNPNVGSIEELIPFDFVAELIAKIRKEENNKTVDQQLEVSNIYKSQSLGFAQKIFIELGSLTA